MVAAKVAALPALKGRISLDSARAALDPHSYLGESVRIAQEGAAMGHAFGCPDTQGISVCGRSLEEGEVARAGGVSCAFLFDRRGERVEKALGEGKSACLQGWQAGIGDPVLLPRSGRKHRLVTLRGSRPAEMRSIRDIPSPARNHAHPLHERASHWVSIQSFDWIPVLPVTRPYDRASAVPAAGPMRGWCMISEERPTSFRGQRVAAWHQPRRRAPSVSAPAPVRK